jgi:heme exporter protein A
MKTPIWILDEPYTSLDVDGIQKIEVMISDHIHQGGAVIMTSHHQVNLHKVDITRLNLSDCSCR